MVKRPRRKKARPGRPKKKYKKQAPRKLSAKQARAHQLVCVQGLTLQEAGDRIGCSRQNISQLVQKAIPKIQGPASAAYSPSAESAGSRTANGPGP